MLWGVERTELLVVEVVDVDLDVVDDLVVVELVVAVVVEVAVVVDSVGVVVVVDVEVVVVVEDGTSTGKFIEGSSVGNRISGL